MNMTETHFQRQALADFLRTRRARLSPADVGLPNGSRRRAPGLRREEVSSLANVGISWYTALEQGRDVRPSEEILNSLADVLRLNADERQHLFFLAGYSLMMPPSRAAEENISPALHHILEALHPYPAYIIGWCWSYLAWNESAERLFEINAPSEPHPRNLMWQLFMQPEKRTFFMHWEKVAQNMVAEFRAEVEKFGSDPYVTGLIDDLCANSPDFARFWQQHNVQRIVIRRKEILHPRVGRMSFDHTPLQLPEHPNLKLIVYTPCVDTVKPLGELLGRQD